MLLKKLVHILLSVCLLCNYTTGIEAIVGFDAFNKLIGVNPALETLVSESEAFSDVSNIGAAYNEPQSILNITGETVMTDTSDTQIAAKKLEGFEFGMHGSNIGEITDSAINLIDGKVRILRIDDDMDADNNHQKSIAVAINKSDYTGSVGRYASLVSANEIIAQIESANNSKQSYEIRTSGGIKKTTELPVTGDKLVVTSEDKTQTKEYAITVVRAALSGKLEFDCDTVTQDTTRDIVLDYYAGQRTPEAEVNIYVPAGINATMENTTVNLIGRGDVLLSKFHESRGTQNTDGTFPNEDAHKLLGRFAVDYAYQTLGTVEIENNPDGSQIIQFRGIDLRPNNGVDLRITIHDVQLPTVGEYNFRADLKTKEPEVLQSRGTGSEEAVLYVTDTISDFERVLDKSLEYKETDSTYTSVEFTWSKAKNATSVKLYQLNGTVSGTVSGGIVTTGETWTEAAVSISGDAQTAKITGLQSNRYYRFRLEITGGENAGYSNEVGFYSGKLDARTMGVQVNVSDQVARDNNKLAINNAIQWLSDIGGGTLWFVGNAAAGSEYQYRTGTIYLKSNVYLYVDTQAKLFAGGGIMDEPESAWWHYYDYGGGTSQASDPYENPDNFLSKQDDGHCFFQNSLIYGRRVDNIKIIGTGFIDGGNNLGSADGTVRNDNKGRRADTLIALKLCTNVEIGGKNIGKDLLFDTTKPYIRSSTNRENNSMPYYEGDPNPEKPDVSNMLDLMRGGHFALLATGTDNINLHDTYYQRTDNGSGRDAYDFMQCRNVTGTNLFVSAIGDDFVKLGSECSLGFTRPAYNHKYRNIIGDTFCNLFQIGSETADDIQDIYVDNMIVLGADKAGFSISTNDGAYVHNVNLNTEISPGMGMTGPLLGNSVFQRARTPFFLSVSHRGRVIGAENRTVPNEAGNGTERVITNVPIGTVEGVNLNNVDISDVYKGSSHAPEAGTNYLEYTTQPEFTAAVVGYKMPKNTPSMCDGRYTGYVKKVTLNDVSLQVKGYNKNGNHTFQETIDNKPRELNVGQFNDQDMGARPSYGIYVRHAKDFAIKDSKLDFERNDDRYPIVFDDVIGAALDNLTVSKGSGLNALFQTRDSTGLNISNSSYITKETGSDDTDEIFTIEDITNFGGAGNMVYPFIGVIALKTKPNASKVVSIDNTKASIKAVEDTTVSELIAEIISTDSSTLGYAVNSSLGVAKRPGDALVEGDKLVCTGNNSLTKTYKINIAAAGIELEVVSTSEKVTSVDNTTLMVEVAPEAVVCQLLLGLESKNTVKPAFNVVSSDGLPKADMEPLVTGDKLVATAQIDGVNTVKTYAVEVKQREESINLNYYNRLNELKLSDPSFKGSSYDNGANYLQTTTVGIGDWVSLDFHAPVNGIYKIELIYKHNTSGRATIQNYIDDIAVGNPINMGTFIGTNVTEELTTASASTNKFFLVPLSSETVLTKGVHKFKSTATESGAIVLHSVIITLLDGGPAYTVPSGLTATYGQILADIVLPEGFSWEGPLETSVGNAGLNSFMVKYTPDNADDYNIVTNILVDILVNDADGFMPGDVNDDGDINIFDIMAIRDHIFGKSQLTQNAFIAADVNNDDDINIFDIMAIRDHIFGKKTIS